MLELLTYNINGFGFISGKTSLIRYLLERDYPGLRIGPEPTTDNFTAVMYGESEQIIPGNALAVDNKKQFRPLTKFGGAFLNRFQVWSDAAEFFFYCVRTKTFERNH